MSTPYFMLVIDREQPGELERVHDIVKEHANGWWHWYTNTWIVGGGGTASEWRDRLKPIIRGGPSSVLVVKLPEEGGRRWAYYGPKATDRGKWLHKNFKN